MMNKEETTQLLNDYIDGKLSDQDKASLLNLLKDPEQRKSLALISIVDRLLKSDKTGPVETKRIMSALPKADMKTAKELKKEKHSHTRKPKKIKKRKEKSGARIKHTDRQTWNTAKSSYEKNSPISITVGIVIIATIGIVGWQLFSADLPDRTTTHHDPIQAQEDPGTKPDKTGLDKPTPKNDKTPDTTKPKDPKPDMSQQDLLNNVTDIPAPKGSGSDEEGFVPPPTGIEKHDKGKKELLLDRQERNELSKTVVKSAPKSRLLVIKLKRGEKLFWNATPNDISNLLDELKNQMKLKYRYEERNLSEIEAKPEEHPIIYFSTHYNFTFTEGERKKLREFMLKGGMMIFNTGLGSTPAYNSALRELQCIFPETPPQPLNVDHPIFHSYYDLSRIKYCSQMRDARLTNYTPQFDGVTFNCRTLALVSRYGMSSGLEGVEEDSYQAYISEDARKLGVNIVSYAIAQRAWTRGLPSRPQAGNGDNSGSKLNVVQVIYDGDWKTRISGLPMLLHTFNMKTEVPVKLAIKEMKLTDKDIFNAPILYITGHDDFYLTKTEVRKLRKYLEGGGFLFAESCCGRKGFDTAFRAEMERVIPNTKLHRIQQNNSIFSNPNKIDKTGVTPSLSAKLKSVVSVPIIEGIKLNGNYVVIYSKYGLAGGWESSQNPYSSGYNNIGSIKLGQNILMYAITH